MYDYIADYAAKYTAAREAQVFWRIVYNFMRSGKCSEEVALSHADPEGESRAKYPRPEGFPGCFAESA